MGQINHAHERYAAAPRQSYRVRSFVIVMGICATIRGQNWVISEIFRKSDLKKATLPMFVLLLFFIFNINISIMIIVLSLPNIY